MYKFYYDESEHSRKINYNTVTAENYYDNFISVIIGWTHGREKEIFEKYSAFEEKYTERRDKNGELKSQTLKQNQFKFGFASLNKQNIQFVDDFLSIFDNEIKFYFSVASKMEYLVLQLFSEYKNNIFVDADAMKYSITKALVVYRPEKVIKCICDFPELFVETLKEFFRDRIDFNKRNIELKEQENSAFNEILNYLEHISVIPETNWDYHMPFDGFRKYLQEEQIKDYFLTLDKEGELDEKSKTLQSACEMGLDNVAEADSLSSCGLQIADMIAGIMSKLLKSLCDSLRYHSFKDGVKKRILDIHWFQMNESHLNLYKKLYRIVCEWDHAWYKSYAGIYSDDLIVFVALLNFMNHFESTKQIQMDIVMQGEYFNAFACSQLSDYFERRRNKLPIEPIADSDTEFFLNQRGAKVYFDFEKQPKLPLREGSQTFDVLSVGVNKNFVPLITILKDGEPMCFRLPEELSEWAFGVVGMANMGTNLFPSKVTFTCIIGKYYVDIL